MISDDYRGWAWTRALLGVQAAEVHVCGDPSVLPLLRAICDATGDAFECHHYHRFAPLTVDQTSLQGDLGRVSPGDCIVAFSRREIFEIKRAVEMTTKHRCCVVYGALPPETRRQQARLFNEEESDFRVLVASDAIGMGLNLSIRRVVFSTLHKFNGEEKIIIPSPMVKQIAGRAGRRGSRYEEGVVTCLDPTDMPLLIAALQDPVEPTTAAGLFPLFEQVEVFASQLPDVSFARLLDRFVETSKLDGTYFLCRTDNIRGVATMLDKIKGLTLRDRFDYCSCPPRSALLPFAPFSPPASGNHAGQDQGEWQPCWTRSRRVATMLDKIKGLTLRDRFDYCSCPPLATMLDKIKGLTLRDRFDYCSCPPRSALLPFAPFSPPGSGNHAGQDQGEWQPCWTRSRRVATMLDKIKGLTLRDRFDYCSCPPRSALLPFAPFSPPASGNHAGQDQGPDPPGPL
ncbi:unnamed protein product [Closterium sp. Naga37s-1]|nr:unnamed protein product [Closterium sp. Naga37s-1]